MYRYVFKRVKDTFEFGVNARKSYACQQANSIKYKNQNESPTPVQQQQQQIVNFQEVNFLPPADYQKKRYEDFKRKYNCKHPYNCNPFLQAITWSTALIAGFYASQLLCLYRRNQRFDPKKCLYTRYLDQKNRLLHRKCFSSHQAKQKHHQQQHRSLEPASKFKCPLQALLARRKSSSTQATTIVEGDVSGLRSDFATLGLFEKRFDTFYNYSGDTSTYKRVYVNVNNINNDSTETLAKSKDTSSDSSNNSNVSPSEDEALNALLTNLSDMIGEIEFQLGVECILNGQYDDAVEHFRMAASSDHASSLFNLALLYEQGLGVKKDRRVAYKLYKSAGALGHDKALFNQGIFHVKGMGGAQKSVRQAKRLFEKSAALGNSDAIEALSSLLPGYQKSFSPVPDDFIVADDNRKMSLHLENANYRTDLLSVGMT